MRDPARIEPFLAELRRVWEANPDQRFGQLLKNLARTYTLTSSPTVTTTNSGDPWHWEDDIWLERLRRVGDAT